MTGHRSLGKHRLFLWFASFLQTIIRLVGLPTFEYTKAQMYQFSHGCSQCRHLALSRSNQPLVMSLHMRVMADGDDSGHIEHSSDMGWTRF